MRLRALFWSLLSLAGPLPESKAISFPIHPGAFTGSQNDSIDYARRRSLACWTGIGGTAVVHAGLYQLWYRDYPSTSFHFFNDNAQWLQMDKAGHAFSSYYLGLAGIEAARWAGVPVSKQWRWALFGSLFQNPIEIWDGFSAGWGASSGDLLANTLGSVLSAGQEALWHEQKITMKFSYSPSPWAAMRPGTLGSSLSERILKDYNAQTYWLTCSPRKNKAAWLGLALGYGANGMLGGAYNIWTDAQNMIRDRRDIPRYRQYYLAFDFNLTRIPTRSKTLKTLLFVVNCIKLPSPAIEFSQGRFKGHWLMF